MCVLSCKYYTKGSLISQQLCTVCSVPGLVSCHNQGQGGVVVVVGQQSFRNPYSHTDFNSPLCAVLRSKSHFRSFATNSTRKFCPLLPNLFVCDTYTTRSYACYIVPGPRRMNPVGSSRFLPVVKLDFGSSIKYVTDDIVRHYVRSTAQPPRRLCLPATINWYCSLLVIHPPPLGCRSIKAGRQFNDSVVQQDR